MNVAVVTLLLVIVKSLLLRQLPFRVFLTAAKPPTTDVKAAAVLRDLGRLISPSACLRVSFL